MKAAEVCAVVLAAGVSSRMGCTKQLLKLGDTVILEHIIRKCLRFPFHQIITVIGHDADSIMETIKTNEKRFQWVINENYAAGQSSSFRKAIERIQNHYRAFMVFLGDEPYIDRNTISFLYEKGLQQLNVSHDPFVIQPMVEKKPAHPVFFGNIDQIDFTTVAGDKGAKDLIRQMKQRIQIAIDDPFIGFDIDTPEDYEQAIQIIDHTKESLL